MYFIYLHTRKSTESIKDLYGVCVRLDRGLGFKVSGPAVLKLFGVWAVVFLQGA